MEITKKHGLLTSMKHYEKYQYQKYQAICERVEYIAVYTRRGHVTVWNFITVDGIVNTSKRIELNRKRDRPRVTWRSTLDQLELELEGSC